MGVEASRTPRRAAGATQTMMLHTGTPEKGPEAGKRESEHRPSPSHSTPSRSPGEAAVQARAHAAPCGLAG